MKYTPITINTLNNASNEYTLELWVYINVYVPSLFDGFNITWDKHLRLSLSYSSGFKSTCYPIYYSSDLVLSAINSNQIPFSSVANGWTYLRCSVDLTNKLYVHFPAYTSYSEYSLSGVFTSITAGTTSLSFTAGNNNNILANEGAIFIRQLRLWNCYLCQDGTVFRKDLTITTGVKYANLLYLFEAPFAVAPVITEVLNATNTSLTLNANWIGYNVFDLSNYDKLTSTTVLGVGNSYLCNEFKDLCVTTIALNQVQGDITFSGINPPLNNRFTIELWYMNTNTSNLSSGVHFIWRNVGSVSFIRDTTTTTTLNTYCWPQDHRLNLLGTTGDTNINALKTSTLNYDSIQTTSSNNTWVWIRCAVNYTNRLFYMNNNTIKTLQSDLLYGVVGNDNPFRYLWQNNETSTFYISGASNHATTGIYIYAKSIYLFSDYIQQTYLFKNK